MKKNVLQICGLAVLFCLFACAGSLSAQTTAMFLVRSDSAWTLPTMLNGQQIKVTSVTFEAWGGGGAGGYVSRNVLGRSTAGGGGGAFATKTIEAPEVGTIYNIVVGKGGKANNADANVNGGESTVTGPNGLLVKAVGGEGVAPNADEPHNDLGGIGGQATACLPTEGAFSGGNGARACDNTSGGGGGAAGATADGGDAKERAVTIGVTFCTRWNVEVAGRGGAGNPSSGDGGQGKMIRVGYGNNWFSSPGDPGNRYGGGGAGSFASLNNSAAGGAGADGVVRVSFTYEEVDFAVENKTVELCSGVENTIELPVTMSGIDPSDVSFSVNLPGHMGVSYNINDPEYNSTTEAWEITVTVTNNNTQVDNNNLSCIATYEGVEHPFTLTLNTYLNFAAGALSRQGSTCEGQSTLTLTMAEATGGSGEYTYGWQKKNGNNWVNVSNVTGLTYTVTEAGTYRGIVTDGKCGEAYTGEETVEAAAAAFNPGSMTDNEGEPLENAAICESEAEFSIILKANPEVTDLPTVTYIYKWEKKVDDEDWTEIDNQVAQQYTVALTGSDFSDVNAISYRYQVKYNQDCDFVLCNNVYTVSKKSSVDYSDQFKDVEITLWYGACDTNIANMEAPELDPEVISLMLDPEQDTLLVAGEHEIIWLVTDNCSSNVQFTQKITVKYPECETLHVNDAAGNTYTPVRIGCDCWLAENLITPAEDAVFFEENDEYESFGLLYTRATALASAPVVIRSTKQGEDYVQGICPDGWAIPTTEQFNNMIVAANGVEDVKATEGWLAGHEGTGLSGFNAMAPGFFNVTAAQYQSHLAFAGFWTADEGVGNQGVIFEIKYSCGDGVPNDVNQDNKYSVRCVKIQEEN